MNDTPTRTFSTMIGRQVISPLGEPFASLMDLIFDVRDDCVRFAILRVKAHVDDMTEGELLSVPWNAVRVDSESGNFVVDPNDLKIGRLAASGDAPSTPVSVSDLVGTGFKRIPVVARLLP